MSGNGADNKIVTPAGLDPSMRPEDLLGMWHHLGETRPIPYKTPEDRVLATLGDHLPDDYAYRSEIPIIEPVPRFPPHVQPLVKRLISDKGPITQTFGPIAEAIAAGCEVPVLSLKQWQRVINIPNTLFVVLNHLSMHYSPNRLLIAPVQVTIGPVMILAVRGFIPLIAQNRIHVADLRYAAKGMIEYANIPINAPDPMNPSGFSTQIAERAIRILTDNGILKPATANA